MKIHLEAQEIDIDLEEVAYKASEGDIVAFAEMIVQFSDHLKKREQKSGFHTGKLFSIFIATILESISEENYAEIKEQINE